ncbi:MAG: SGNH/GDSL hydrolase family protein [Myxococcales bacterium]|nr:SGNH/GDSL hydrolase family protein [Myxococcales bacterium]
MLNKTITPRGWRTVSAFAIVAASLVVCELVLRLIWTNPYRNELPDRLLEARLPHRGIDLVWDRTAVDASSPVVRFRTDDRGYILGAKRFDHPDLTVAFVGGSTTECSAVAEGRRTNDVFSTQLASTGLRVNALNAGKNATTLHDSLNNWLNHIVNDQPDVVVIMHVANDVGELATRGDYARRQFRDDNAGRSFRTVAKALSRLTSVGGSLRNSVAGLPSPAQVGPTVSEQRKSVRLRDILPYRQRLLAMVRSVRAFGAEPVLVTEPLSSMRNELTPKWADTAGQDALNQVVREVGLAEAATVVDLARHVQFEVPNYLVPMHIFYDGMHVTDRGARVYGEELARRLGPWLSRMAAAKSRR